MIRIVRKLYNVIENAELPNGTYGMIIMIRYIRQVNKILGVVL